MRILYLRKVWTLAAAAHVVFPITLTQGLSSSTSSSRPPSRSSSSTPSQQQQQRKLVADLQQSVTPEQVLETVVPRLKRGSSIDPDGSLASLILVRLSKQLIGRDNNNNNNNQMQNSSHHQQQKSGNNVDDELLIGTVQQQEQYRRLLQHVATCLAESDLSNVEALVEGTKAYALLRRLLSGMDENKAQQQARFATELYDSGDEPLIRLWEEHGQGVALAPYLEDHQLSGLKWAFDTFALVDEQQQALRICCWADAFQKSFNDLELPFSILPGCVRDDNDDFLLSVATLSEQVDFRVDDIRTVSNKIVKERRQTAWQGDLDVAPFGYAGKSMPRSDWSPVVRQVRDRLFQQTGQYYDCCLLNLYPDGQSGMRYHIDPDQGILWDYDTSVVSVGATRRFAFRPIENNSNNHAAASIKGQKNGAAAPKQQQQQQQPHSFVVLQGDVAHMFGDCQQRFQHTVKKADNRFDASPRSSLVFKRTWKP